MTFPTHTLPSPPSFRKPARPVHRRDPWTQCLSLLLQTPGRWPKLHFFLKFKFNKSLIIKSIVSTELNHTCQVSKVNASCSEWTRSYWVTHHFILKSLTLCTSDTLTLPLNWVICVLCSLKMRSIAHSTTFHRSLPLQYILNANTESPPTTL